MKYNLEISNININSDSLDGIISQLECAVGNIDFMPIVSQIKNEIQALDPDVPIVFEENEGQSVLAHLEYGRHHHTPYHKISFKKSFICWQHAIVHELMHLEMYIKASKVSNGYVFKKNAENEKFFAVSYGANFRKLIPQYGIQTVQGLQKIVQDGLITLSLSTPLDLFVEQRIHDRYKNLELLQALSLLLQEKININQYLDSSVKLMPPKIVSVNRVLCMTNSLRLMEFYGLDLLDEYRPTKKEKNQAEEFYEEFQAYKDNFKDGDEYELYDYFSETLGVEKIVNKVKE